VNSALELAEQHAGAHNATIINKIGDAKFTVKANKQRVQQIVWNFVSNAVKYGGGRVTVEARPTDGHIRVSVSDNGPGIPKDKQDLLFQPFERLGLEKSRVEGVGLGLAISKRFAQAMDGDVGYEPAPDGGCTFWVDLLASGAGVAPALADGPSNGKAGPDGRILVVDDAESTVMLMKRILDVRPGYEVVVANSGSEAIQKASERPFDLILLDLHLPDLNGDEVIRRLKEGESTRDIPVVIVTADAVSSQAEALRMVGASDYVTKPFRTREILDLVDSYIERARARV
jgi:CheY-like chemotaxis protein/anti-sigma regulatory factor (Ser/Thr protein kinase)